MDCMYIEESKNDHVSKTYLNGKLDWTGGFEYTNVHVDGLGYRWFRGHIGCSSSNIYILNIDFITYNTCDIIPNGKPVELRNIYQMNSLFS